MSDKDLVTVSALVLLDQDKRILISERPKGKFMQGFWEFPGGKLEKGENPEICLIREIKEEIGVDLENFCISEHNFGAIFAVTEITPTPPFLLNSKAKPSSPVS